MSNKKIPLVQLPEITANDDSDDMNQAARQVSEALATSGFLLVQSHHLTKKLQQEALQVTHEILNDKDNKETILHPVDPKKYIMVETADKIASLQATDQQQQKILQEYWASMEKIKHQVLRCISLGLGLSSGYFSECHEKNNSCLRLLHYPVPEVSSSKEEEEDSLIIRCKAHSDYGSVTLLTTDGVGGLQAMIDGEWTNVPYVEGSIVVNIGSLLSDWTQGKLLSTLHRVVSNDNSSSAPARTSIAFFADPDSDISASLGSQSSSSSEAGGVTVAEYIKYRAGGDNRDREGVAFTTDETNRVEGK